MIWNLSPDTDLLIHEFKVEVRSFLLYYSGFLNSKKCFVLILNICNCLCRYLLHFDFDLLRWFILITWQPSCWVHCRSLLPRKEANISWPSCYWSTSIANATWDGIIPISLSHRWIVGSACLMCGYLILISLPLGLWLYRKMLSLLHIVLNLTILNMKWQWNGAYYKKEQITHGENCTRYLELHACKHSYFILPIIVLWIDLFILKFLQQQGEELRKVKAKLKAKWCWMSLYPNLGKLSQLEQILFFLLLIL